MKRAKTRVKVAIASALAISSTAAVIYAAPEIMKAVTYRASEEAVYLDVEKLTSSTVKVSTWNGRKMVGAALAGVPWETGRLGGNVTS